MKKTNKKEVLTDVQIEVDSKKRTSAADAEIGKVCEKYQVALVPVIDFQPTMIRPVIKIVSTKKYEQSEQSEENQPVGK